MKKESAMQKARRNKSGNRVVVCMQEKADQYHEAGSYYAIEIGRDRSFNLANRQKVAEYRNGKRIV